MTVTITAVVGLAFLFGFGNVWALALHLGITPWVAPLVAPAVDLSVIGLLLGTRHLALHGARPEQLRPARRLLVFSSFMTLALNVAEPVLSGQYGKAAFDAVGPLLLIGWAEVGPGLLQAISTASDEARDARGRPTHQGAAPVDSPQADGRAQPEDAVSSIRGAAYSDGLDPGSQTVDDLLDRARREDAQHWAEHRRPISSDTLRKRLGVGSARARMLVSILRSDVGRNQAIGGG
ncbi:SpdA protein [Streptomyces sp. Y7]|uniref:SpdA protein n=1 Tax=Streptomyces sp. Y7 TaxID=3342392 RepID=UPI0037227CC4